jgi:molybdopterin/thiamine biosynthesis adenylyltransferase
MDNQALTPEEMEMLQEAINLAAIQPPTQDEEQEQEEISSEEAANVEPDTEINEEETTEEAASTEPVKVTIPTNSPTLLINETVSRFSGAEWFEAIHRTAIVVAGQGGIGSWLSFMLSRMNVGSLTIYDDDVVERVNMAGQFFSKDDINKTKVAAVANNLSKFSDYYMVNTMRQKFTRHSNTSNIMMCGFDSMLARKQFFHAWKAHVEGMPEESRYKCLYVDGRLSAEEFQVFCITGADNFLMRKYMQDWLFDDDAAEEAPCSYKQTSFCANMIAAVMANLLVNFIANQCNPLIPRELPFFTSYDASRMFFKTEG